MEIETSQSQDSEFILNTLKRLADDSNQFRECNQDIQEDILLNLRENNIAGLYLTPLRFDLFGQQSSWDKVVDQIQYSQFQHRRTQ